MARLTPERTKVVTAPFDPDGATVRIRYIKPGKRRDLQIETNTVTAKAGSTFDATIEFDLKKKKRAYYEALIKDWDGWYDKDDEPLPCDIDCILQVDEEFGEFHSWLKKEDAKFAQEIAELEKAARGN